MGSLPISTSRADQTAASLIACLCAGAILLGAAAAVAQDSNTQPPPATGDAPAAQPDPSENRGLFGNIGRWLDEQTSNLKSGLSSAGSKVGNIGQEAGAAAKGTVDTAKDAAGAVARIPTARMVSGHEQCANAPNGAPDCVAAATTMCKTKGFESGKSVDMTTAEVCPAQVYLSGRNSGPGCHTETFVSRAFCQ